MHKKKILFIITGMGIGGAEKQLCFLADKLVDLNYTVKIISLCGAQKVFPSNLSVEVISLGIKKNFFGVIAGIYKIRGIIKKYAPDIVHGHMFHANALSRVASIGLRRNMGIISTAHSKNEGGWSRMLAYRLTDDLCDICTNVSHEALLEFIKLKAFKKNKSLTIYNGIDTDIYKFNERSRVSIHKELGINDDEIMLLAVGRLTSAKDYPNLLSAMTLLPPHFRLIIIGDGELRNEIEDMIIKYDLNSRVQILGAKENVSLFYSACDIFVLSSAWEGFGLVVAEAMSCERIVVATDAGGVKEVLEDNKFIVPISDSTLLAKKIAEVAQLSDEDKKAVMLQNRKRVIDNFSISETVTKWENIYTKLQGSK